MKSIQKPQPATRLLSPEEAAAMLGTTPGVLSVWRSTHRYPLPWVKIGRSVRYRPSDIEAFIDSRTISPVEV
ncbi:helix-turn-helix domain-containing protein [Desulfobulbus sp.]|uniref:helix-turn-helix domain-containing protein n=1 Tax=Desulfobulbus sp. TaxID=895 RepID=UPI00286F95A7|nr:helix-turn-helix domain-containing protein [Desulfobulbus sp.]